MGKEKLSVVQKLHSKGLIKPPAFVVGGTQYETIMGSMAYGVSSDASDVDVYGFCMPPKDYVFPHLAGHIPGFSTQVQGFDQYQQHHITDKSARKEYDMSIYSIVKYFKLCMDNNPNMIDSLFTAQNMVLSQTRIGQMVRDNRKIFLSKKSWHSFKGYAYSQMHKMRIKNPDENSKRYEMVQKYGYDVKFAYHVVRLLDEVEQILRHGDIDLMRDRERLKSIRRGEWKLEDIELFFSENEKSMWKLYEESNAVPGKPDELKIRQLLFDCMEEYYGDLSSAVVVPDESARILREVKKLVEKY